MVTTDLKNRFQDFLEKKYGSQSGGFEIIAEKLMAGKLLDIESLGDIMRQAALAGWNTEQFLQMAGLAASSNTMPGVGAPPKSPAHPISDPAKSKEKVERTLRAMKLNTEIPRKSSDAPHKHDPSGRRSKDQ